MKLCPDKRILTSWQRNVAPWVKAVREGEIESRVAVTNGAVIDAIAQRSPATVIDLGCGEGWLVRELEALGIDTLGVDAVPALIDAANEAGSGRFRVSSFETLAAVALNETFDVAVCNFSLLGNEPVTQLFQQLPSLLNDGGHLIVQTIHPLEGCGDQEYRDGWREGSWAGFSDEFCDPAPWYFRTLESWESLFADYGFRLVETVEPANPDTGSIASIIFIGKLNCKGGDDED